MKRNSEIGLELAVAGLLKAAGPNKEELIRTANAMIISGQLDEIAGGTQHKSSALQAIRDFSAKV